MRRPSDYFVSTWRLGRECWTLVVVRDLGPASYFHLSPLIKLIRGKSMPGIVGLITNNPDVKYAEAQLSKMMHCMRHESFYAYGTCLLPGDGCYLGWVSHPKSFSDCNPIINPAKDRILV